MRLKCWHDALATQQNEMMSEAHPQPAATRPSGDHARRPPTPVITSIQS